MKKFPVLLVGRINGSGTTAHINYANVLYTDKCGSETTIYFVDGSNITVRSSDVEDDLKEFYFGVDNEIYRLQCQIDELKEQLAAHKRKGHDPFAAD